MGVVVRGARAAARHDVGHVRFPREERRGRGDRSVEAYKSFNFAKYRYYRLVWGGLAPSTTYTLEMRRRSTADAERYLDSEWVAVQVTTDADPAADHADCLLYADFERMPTGGQPLYGAYGFSYGATEDFSDPDRVDYTAPGDKNSIYCQAVKAERSYFDAYLPAWDLDDWTKNSSNMGMAAGYMKFGGGSKPAWLTRPAFPRADRSHGAGTRTGCLLLLRTEQRRRHDVALEFRCGRSVLCGDSRRRHDRPGSRARPPGRP